MKRQSFAIASLALLSVLSFSSIAKAGVIVNQASVDGYTIDRTQPTLKRDGVIVQGETNDRDASIIRDGIIVNEETNDRDGIILHDGIIVHQ